MDEVDHFEDETGTDTFFFDEEEDELQTVYPNLETKIPTSTKPDTFLDFDTNEEVDVSNIDVVEQKIQNDDKTYQKKYVANRL